MISFTQFDTLFLVNPTNAKQFAAGQQVYLYRNGQLVSEQPMTVSRMDDCVGFVRMTEQKICKLAKRGDDLRKEVRQ